MKLCFVEEIDGRKLLAFQHGEACTAAGANMRYFICKTKLLNCCGAVTTTDDAQAKQIEPGAPLVSARLKAMKKLAENGIHTGVTMMPILPFIQDNEENITDIVNKAKDAGASYILPWFGMSLRDRQRAYYYQKLDNLFPGLRRQYEQTYGNRYGCAVNNAQQLRDLFYDLCQRLNIATTVPQYAPEAPPEQLSLF